jgi:cyanophycinase-like exopeptidase/predicted transcriptional regulator
MERASLSSGTVTLMGSGELTESMTRVHQWIASRIDGPVRAVFLDTPAGFELNADDISERARNYVRRYLGVSCALAGFKSANSATDAEMKNAVRKIEGSNYIFAGPGSPSYAIRNWAGTPIIDAVARRIDEGGHLVLASAAAIAISHYSLPVYEIYKVGDDPHWIEGLNLLAPCGLDLTIVPHWNNSEGGTYDTRFCFMGKPRFDALEALLPEWTVIVGVDEYTACILVLGEDQCHVMGAGRVTVRRPCGEDKVFPANSTFSLDELRSAAMSLSAPVLEAPVRKSAAQAKEDLARTVGETERTLTERLDGRSDAEIAGQAYELVQAIEHAEAGGAEAEVVAQARAELRTLVDRWCKEMGASGGELVANLAPFVELLIELRQKLRAARQWELADELRDRLAALGIVLEDAAGGTTWRKR